MSGRQHLQIPGPTMMPDRVRNAMARQAIDYRDPEILQISNHCFDRLRTLFGTDGEVIVYTSSGHGGWEGVIDNVTAVGDRVVVPGTGTFGLAWAAMAADLGLDPVVVEMDQRRAIRPDAIHELLAADTGHTIRAVFAVHTETATGVTSDLAAIRAAIDAADHPALLVADAIASFATTPLPMDDWGVDIVITASQKGLMGPPGLAPVGVGRRALEAAALRPRPTSYWSWSNRLEAEGYRRFCGTPPMHLLFALDAALTLIAEEGIDRVHDRHRRLAAATQAAVEEWGADGAMELNAVIPAERATAITCVRLPEAVDATALGERIAAASGVIVGGTMGDLEGRGFRIGHLGDLNEATLLGSLAAIELGFRRCAVDHRSGGVTAAIASLG